MTALRGILSLYSLDSAINQNDWASVVLRSTA